MKPTDVASVPDERDAPAQSQRQVVFDHEFGRIVVIPVPVSLSLAQRPLVDGWVVGDDVARHAGAEVTIGQ